MFFEKEKKCHAFSVHLYGSLLHSLDKKKKKKIDTLSRNYEKRSRNYEKRSSNYEIRKGASLIVNDIYGNCTEAALTSCW